MYIGKITNCYTQALLSSFMDRYDLKNLYDFEIATTVPFGVVYREGDPNRLLDCYLDPDVGLDRGMSNLDISFDIRYWSQDSDWKEAFNTLNTWCAEAPVVLGPLNMENLTYYFRGDLYKNMDHYIVVMGVDSGKYSVCDPEGLVDVYLQENDLRIAWKADEIPEGRGSFTMRRVIGKNREIRLDTKTIKRVIRNSIENLYKAEILKNGGSNGLKMIANDSERITSCSSLVRGFSYAIPTRVQRCLLSKMLLEMALELNICCGFNAALKDAVTALDSQIFLYGEVLNRLNRKENDALKLFEEIASYENKITYLLSNISI